MPELLDNADTPVPLLLVHRDIGRLEGRVQALEGDTRDIKSSLNVIYGRINEIWSVVSLASGEKKGERQTKHEIADIVGWCVNALIASLTAWVMVHYGR